MIKKLNMHKFVFLLLIIWGCSNQITELSSNSNSDFVLAYDTMSLGDIFFYDSSKDFCENITTQIVDTAYFSFVSSFSSDGSKLLFTVDYLKPGNEEWDFCDRDDIFCYDLFSDKIVRLSNNEHKEIYPSFSKNGENIIYTSNYNGNSEIYIMESSGDNRRRIVSISGYIHKPQFIMNDKKILYHYYKNGKKEFYLNDLSGKNEEQLTFNDIFGELSISRTGDFFIYSSSEGICKYDFNSKSSTLLIPNPNTTGFDINLRPRVSPDDQYIVYQNTKGLFGRTLLYNLEYKNTVYLGEGYLADFTPDSKSVILLKRNGIFIHEIETYKETIIAQCNSMYYHMVMGSIK